LTIPQQPMERRDAKKIGDGEHKGKERANTAGVRSEDGGIYLSKTNGTRDEIAKNSIEFYRRRGNGGS